MVNGVFVSNPAFWTCLLSCFGSKATVWARVAIKDKSMSSSINSSAVVPGAEIVGPSAFAVSKFHRSEDKSRSNQSSSNSVTAFEIQSNQNFVADDVPE